MGKGRNTKYDNCLVLIGCMVILLPVSLDQYWGSLSVYALSYFVSYLSYDSEIQTPWTISTFFMFWTSGFLASGLLGKRFGPREMICGGSVIVNIGAFLNYFTVQSSFLLFNATQAGMFGIGFGIIYGNAVKLVAYATEKHVGLFISLLMVASSIGAFVFNQLTTWYTNPGNESPNYRLGATIYFTQRDVIDRVPSMFLLLSGCILATQVVGLSLLNFPTISSALSRCLCAPKSTEETAFNERTHSIECTSLEKADKINGDYCDVLRHQHKDYSPKEMVKTARFYVLCLSFVCSEYLVLLLSNYYKLFGQIWIHDDHFLTGMSTTFVITTAVLRAVNGLILDKLGSRNCLVIFISASTIMAVWFFFTAMTNQWLYFFVTVMFASVNGSLYSCYFASVALIFGKAHLTANLGIILISTILLNLSAPQIIEAILTNFGWFTLFVSGGALQIMNVVLCIVFIF